jgi:hypothetical protein
VDEKIIPDGNYKNTEKKFLEPRTGRNYEWF